MYDVGDGGVVFGLYNEYEMFVVFVYYLFL